MIAWLKRFFHRAPNCRRFRHVGGFSDSTAYIQVDSDGSSYIVTTSGLARRTYGYDIDVCLGYVKSGEWIELEVV